MEFNKRGWGRSTRELVLYSLGLGPALMTLILYYLFLFVPGKENSFYVLFVCLCFIVLGILGRGNFLELCRELRGFKLFRKPSSVVLLGALALWTFTFLYKPISGGDFFEYLTQGKVFYNTKKISYSKYVYDDKTNFFYTGLHGFSFPLLASWERMTNALIGFDGDLYVKSISGYYWFLLVLLFAFWANKLDSKFRALPIIYFSTIPGLVRMLLDFSIDSFRIYFYVLMTISFVLLVKNKDIFSAIVLGVISGLASNIHSLTTLLFIAYSFICFLFLEGSFFNRAKKIILVLLISIIFGNVHYILDLVYGTGWILPKAGCPTCRRYLGTFPFKKMPVLSDVFGEIVRNLTQEEYTTAEKLNSLGDPTEYVFNGYFGHFFRFKIVGIFNCVVILILFLFLVSYKKNSKLEWFFFCIYLFSLGLISVKGYANFRYSLTLLPISTYVIFYFICKRRSPVKNMKIINAVLLFCILYNLYSIASIKSIKRSINLFLTNPRNIGNKNSDMEDIANFIKNLPASKSDHLISNGYYFAYYYTDKIPITYCWSGFNVCYKKEGVENIFLDRNEDTSKRLHENFGGRYILSSGLYNSYNEEFGDYLKNQTDLIYTSGDYHIYKIRDSKSMCT